MNPQEVFSEGYFYCFSQHDIIESNLLFSLEWSGVMRAIMGRLALVFVAIIWGNGFPATALALNYYNPYQILALRFTLAFILLVGVFHQKLREMKLEDVRKGAKIGLFLFTAFYFQTVGLQYTTASKNAFLTAVNIVIVPFLSLIILKERVSKRTFIGAFVTLIGIMFLSFDFSSLDSLLKVNIGDILTLVCAFFFALQIFYTDYFVKEVDVAVIMIAQMGVATLLSWGMVFLTHSTAMTMTKESIIPIIYLGIFSTMVAFGIQTWAQKRTTSSEAALILSTESFFGMIASVFWLGEQLSSSLVLGAILIFAGIIMVETK